MNMASDSFRVHLFFIFLIVLGMSFSTDIPVTPFNTKQVNIFKVGLTPVFVNITSPSTATSYFYFETKGGATNEVLKRLTKENFKFDKKINLYGIDIYQIVDEKYIYNGDGELQRYFVIYDNEKTFTDKKNSKFIIVLNHDYPSDTFFWFESSDGITSYSFDPDLTSCGTISASGTYNLLNNVDASGTCFTITASDVNLNCNGYTINFSKAPTSTAYGILISSSNVRVDGCNIIVQNKTAGSTSTVAGGIRITNNNVNISNTNVSIDNGIYSYPVWISAGGNNINISNVVVDTTKSDRVGGLIRFATGSAVENISIDRAVLTINSTNSLGNTGACIYLTYANNVSITNSNLTSLRGTYAGEISFGTIHAIDSKNIYVANSNFSLFDPTSTLNVWFLRTNNTKVYNSRFYQQTNGNDLRYEYSTNNTASNLYIEGGNAGIVLFPANYTSVSNVLVNSTYNISSGLYLKFGSSHNVFNNFTFVGNTNHKSTAGVFEFYDGSASNVNNTFSKFNFSWSGACMFGCFNITSQPNYINTTIEGNYYYNITSYEIYDTDGDGLGNAGSQYPVNSTNTPGVIYGTVQDYKPYTTRVLSATPVYSCGVITSSGNYIMTGNITATSLPCITISASNVNFNGNGFWLKCPSTTATDCMRISASNVVVENITVNYTSSLSSSGQSAIRVFSGDNFVLKNSNIYGSVSRYFYAIWLGSGNNHLIDNTYINTFDSNSPYCAYVNSGSNHRINRLTCYVKAPSNTGAGIFSSSDNVVIGNSTITALNNVYAISSSGSNLVVDNVNATSTSLWSIYLSNGNYASLSYVNATSTSTNAIYFPVSNYSNISHSYFATLSATYYPVYSKSHYTIYNNITTSGILFDNSFNNTLINSKFSDSSIKRGISGGNSFIKMENNIFNFTTFDSLNIKSESNSVFANNSVYGCGTPTFQISSNTNVVNVTVRDNYVNSTCTANIVFGVGYDTDSSSAYGIYDSNVYNNTAISPSMSSGTQHTFFIGALTNSNVTKSTVIGGGYGVVLKNNKNVIFDNFIITDANYSLYVKSGEDINTTNGIIQGNIVQSFYTLNIDKNTSFSFYPYPNRIHIENVTITKNGNILFSNGTNIYVKSSIFPKTIYIRNTDGIQFNNNVVTSTGYCFDAIANNILLENNLMTCDLTAINISGSGNVYKNTIYADVWVNSSGSFFFNTTDGGNKYYLRDGTPAYNIYSIYDGNGDMYADYGDDYPFSSSTIPERWSGTATDYMPYAPVSAKIYPVVFISPIQKNYGSNENISINFTDASDLSAVYNVSVFYSNNSLFTVIAIDGTDKNYTFNASGTNAVFYVNVKSLFSNGSVLESNSDYFYTFDSDKIEITKMWNTYPSGGYITLKANINKTSVIAGYKIYLQRCGSEPTLIYNISDYIIGNYIEYNLSTTKYILSYECSNYWILNVSSLFNSDEKSEYISIPPTINKGVGELTNTSLYVIAAVIIFLVLRLKTMRNWFAAVMDVFLFMFAAFILVLAARELSVSSPELSDSLMNVATQILPILFIPFFIILPLMLLYRAGVVFFKPFDKYKEFLFNIIPFESFKELFAEGEERDKSRK